eukprot:jgi/Bigna1/78978/fgenesh1_pg.58_\
MGSTSEGTSALHLVCVPNTRWAKLGLVFFACCGSQLQHLRRFVGNTHGQQCWSARRAIQRCTCNKFTFDATSLCFQVRKQVGHVSHSSIPAWHQQSNAATVHNAANQPGGSSQASKPTSWLFCLHRSSPRSVCRNWSHWLNRSSQHAPHVNHGQMATAKSADVFRGTRNIKIWSSFDSIIPLKQASASSLRPDSNSNGDVRAFAANMCIANKIPTHGNVLLKLFNTSRCLVAACCFRRNVVDVNRIFCLRMGIPCEKLKQKFIKCFYIVFQLLFPVPSKPNEKSFLFSGFLVFGYTSTMLTGFPRKAIYYVASVVLGYVLFGPLWALYEEFYDAPQFERFVSTVFLLILASLYKLVAYSISSYPSVSDTAFKNDPEFLKRIGVIVPCHKSEKEIGKTLMSILKHIQARNIIVVDNANAELPPDNTRSGLKTRALWEGVNLLPLEVDFVIHIDDDTIFPENMVFDITHFKDEKVDREFLLFSQFRYFRAIYSTAWFCHDCYLLSIAHLEGSKDMARVTYGNNELLDGGTSKTVLWTRNFIFRVETTFHIIQTSSQLGAPIVLTLLLANGEFAFIFATFGAYMFIQMAFALFINYILWNHRPDIQQSLKCTLLYPLYTTFLAIAGTVGNIKCIVWYMPFKAFNMGKFKDLRVVYSTCPNFLNILEKGKRNVAKGHLTLLQQATVYAYSILSILSFFFAAGTGLLDIPGVVLGFKAVVGKKTFHLPRLFQYTSYIMATTLISFGIMAVVLTGANFSSLNGSAPEMFSRLLNGSDQAIEFGFWFICISPFLRMSLVVLNVLVCSEIRAEIDAVSILQRAHFKEICKDHNQWHNRSEGKNYVQNDKKMALVLPADNTNEDGEDLEFGIRDELAGDDMHSPRSLQNSTRKLLPLSSHPPNEKDLMGDEFEDTKQPPVQKKTGDFMPQDTSSSNNLRIQRPKDTPSNPLTKMNHMDLNKEESTSRSMLATYADY